MKYLCLTIILLYLSLVSLILAEENEEMEPQYLKVPVEMIGEVVDIGSLYDESFQLTNNMIVLLSLAKEEIIKINRIILDNRVLFFAFLLEKADVRMAQEDHVELHIPVLGEEGKAYVDKMEMDIVAILGHHRGVFFAALAKDMGLFYSPYLKHWIQNKSNLEIKLKPEDEMWSVSMTSYNNGSKSSSGKSSSKLDLHDEYLYNYILTNKKEINF